MRHCHAIIQIQPILGGKEGTIMMENTRAALLAQAVQLIVKPSLE